MMEGWHFLKLFCCCVPGMTGNAMINEVCNEYKIFFFFLSPSYSLESMLLHILENKIFIKKSYALKMSTFSHITLYHFSCHKMLVTFSSANELNFIYSKILC